jgi:hypothetical protein
VRIPYVWQLTHSIDFLYVFTDFTIWSTVENGVGIIASSIATLRPLFRKAVDLTRGSSTAPSNLPRYSTTPRRNSVRGTAFHCRGLSESQQQDVEKALASKQQESPSRKKVVLSGEVVEMEKPLATYARPDQWSVKKETSPQRATYDCRSSHSGWSWSSRDPNRDSKQQDSVEEWVEDWGNSARSSRSRLMSSRSEWADRRTTW